jgi:hypothetical protein
MHKLHHPPTVPPSILPILSHQFPIQSYITLPSDPSSTLLIHSQQHQIHKLRHPRTFPTQKCTSSQPANSIPQTTPPSQMSLSLLYLYTAKSIQSTNYTTLATVPHSTLPVQSQQDPIHKIKNPPNCPLFPLLIHIQQYPNHKLHQSPTFPTFHSTYKEPAVSIHKLRHLPT